MSRSDILCIYIEFPMIKREYECRVNLDNRFQDILEQLVVLKSEDFGDMYQLSNLIMIQCNDTKQYCSMHESLRTLTSKRGMTFQGLLNSVKILPWRFIAMTKFNDMKYTRPDFEETKAKMEELVSEMRQAKDAETFLNAFWRMNKLRRHLYTMIVLVNIRHSINTADEFYDAEITIGMKQVHYILKL